MFRILARMFPSSSAWALSADNTLKAYIEALAGFLDDIKAEAQAAWLDYLPAHTRRLSDWQDQFGITGGRSELSAAWKATGGQSPKYLQDVLQGRGFNLYVHEWWTPESVPMAGVQSCATARDADALLTTAPNAGTFNAQCGEPELQCGEPIAQAGNTSGARGYTLVNVIESTRQNFTAQCGAAAIQCGELGAMCGQYSDYETRRRAYPVPPETEKYAYFYYVGAQTFPDLAAVPASRRAELEALVLRYAPAHLWGGMLVTYI